MLDFTGINATGGNLLFKASAIGWWNTGGASDFTMIIPFTSNESDAATSGIYHNTTIKALACGYTASSQSFYIYARHGGTGASDPARFGLIINDGTTNSNKFVELKNGGSTEFNFNGLYRVPCLAAFTWNAATKTGKVLVAIPTSTDYNTTAWETADSTVLTGFLAPTAVTIGGQRTTAVIGAPSNVKPQRFALGPACVFSDVNITLADLQTLCDRKDVGAVANANKLTGVAALSSMSSGILKWIGDSCAYPDDAGQAIFKDSLSVATTIADPDAEIDDAGVRIFDASSAGTFVELPTSGDVVAGTSIPVERPTTIGFEIDMTLVEACGGSGAADVAGKAPNTYKWARGTMPPGIIFISGNSRANRNNTAGYPTSLAFVGDGTRETEISLLPSTGLSYASDYATKETGKLAATFAAGMAYCKFSRDNKAAGGYAHCLRSVNDLEGPFGGRNYGADRKSGTRTIQVSSSAYPSTEVANIADWSRLMRSGGVGDGSAGAGLGQGVYVDPGASNYFEDAKHPMIGRAPEDALKLLVVLAKGPGLSTNVDISRGYRDSGDVWQQVDIVSSGIDLSTETATGTIGAYTKGTKSVNLSGLAGGSLIRPGEGIGWRRGTTDYYGIGVYNGAFNISEIGGNINSIATEFELGGTWDDGVVTNSAYPQTGDTAYIGPIGYHVVEVTITVAELEATTGTFDNNAAGVRVLNKDANRPVVIERIIPVTPQAGRASFVPIGQSGAGYDDWNGADTAANKRQFDTVFNGGGLDTTPLGLYFAAFGSNLKAFWMRGAQQTSGTASMLRIIDTLAAASPACDRVVIADPALPPESGTEVYNDLSFSGNKTYWEAHRTAIISNTNAAAFVMATHRNTGHPASMMFDGVFIDNQHWTETGAEFIGQATHAALLNPLIILQGNPKVLSISGHEFELGFD